MQAVADKRRLRSLRGILVWSNHLFTGVLRVFTLKKVWIAACTFLLSIYITILILYAMYPGYVDHVEPNIASVSWIITRGAPLYHELGSAARYSLLYGPMVYLPFSAALQLLGANLVSLKLVVLAENLALVLLLFLSYKKLLFPAGALLVTTGVILYLMQTGFYFLLVRGDILLVLLVALGLYAVVCTSSWLSVFLLSLACGICFDVKFTGLVYMFPLYVLMLQQHHGRRRVALASVGAIVVAAAPFFLPGISLEQYLVWLRVAGRHPFAWKEFQHDLGALVALFAPVALLLWRLRLRGWPAISGYLNTDGRFLLSLVGCMAVMTIPASTAGTGPHHFMAFTPVLGYVCSDLYRRGIGQNRPSMISASGAFLPILWSCMVLVLVTQLAWHFRSTGQYSVAALYRERPFAESVNRDIQGIVDRNPGKRIEMGYGNVTTFAPGQPYEMTFYRSALVFAGGPFTLDASAFADMQLSGVPVPKATIDYMRECRTEIWVIPRDSPPFTGLNIFSQYFPRIFYRHALFENSFRSAFLDHYQKAGTSKYFDLWECSMPPAHAHEGSQGPS